MSKRSPRCKRYVLTFKDGNEWKDVFNLYPEEQKKIRLIQWINKAEYSITLRDSRAETKTKEIYSQFTVNIYATFERTDHLVSLDNDKPLYIYPEPCTHSC
jgi:hypothetical protein